MVLTLLQQKFPKDISKLILTFIPTTKCKYCRKYHVKVLPLLFNKNCICDDCLICVFNFLYCKKKKNGFVFIKNKYLCKLSKNDD